MELDAKRIALLKDELRRDLEALERVERLMAFKGNSLIPDASPPVRTTPEAAPPKAKGSDILTPPLSLIGTIQKLFTDNPTATWTTNHVLEHLQKIGFELKAEKPIYSIGQILRKLVERGEIRVVRRGGGSEPHHYQANREGDQSGTGEKQPDLPMQ